MPVGTSGYTYLFIFRGGGGGLHSNGADNRCRHLVNGLALARDGVFGGGHIRHEPQAPALLRVRVGRVLVRQGPDVIGDNVKDSGSGGGGERLRAGGYGHGHELHQDLEIGLGESGGGASGQCAGDIQQHFLNGRGGGGGGRGVCSGEAKGRGPIALAAFGTK